MKINAFQGQNPKSLSMRSIILKENWTGADSAAERAHDNNIKNVLQYCNEHYSSEFAAAKSKLEPIINKAVELASKTHFIKFMPNYRGEGLGWAYTPIRYSGRGNSYSREDWQIRETLNPESVIAWAFFKEAPVKNGYSTGIISSIDNSRDENAMQVVDRVIAKLQGNLERYGSVNPTNTAAMKESLQAAQEWKNFIAELTKLTPVFRVFVQESALCFEIGFRKEDLIYTPWSPRTEGSYFGSDPYKYRPMSNE